MQKPSGLTDKEQSLLVLISGLLIMLGAITVPSTLPYHEYVGIFLLLLGAVGLALKEWAGGLISASQATLESIAAGLQSLTQLQVAQQKPQTPAAPAPAPIDKAKLAADLAQMAMQLVEKATATPAPTDASPTATPAA